MVSFNVSILFETPPKWGVKAPIFDVIHQLKCRVFNHKSQAQDLTFFVQ